MTFDAASLNQSALAAVLDWYVEMGVDVALDDAPHDRYAESAQALAKAPPAPLNAPPAPDAAVGPSCETPAPRPVRTTSNRSAAVLLAPEEAARAARDAATSAQTLEDLAARLEAFEHAPFKSTAQHFLFGAGTPGSRLIVFDYAPSEEEERSGEAFCGARARLLDNMLAAIGQSRASVSFAYLSPWRPPGDKGATPQETAILAPFARRHVELARPEILLLFGEAPTRALLEVGDTPAQLRGQWFERDFGQASARLMVFLGLDAMLKNAALKRSAWPALREVSGALA